MEARCRAARWAHVAAAHRSPNTGSVDLALLSCCTCCTRLQLTHPCRFVGVDKFYLRENGNSSSIEADLQPYVEAGIVDFGLVDGPKHPTQTNWYNRCSNLAQPQHSWVAFIDLDEFIVVLNRCEQSQSAGNACTPVPRTCRCNERARGLLSCTF